MVTPALRVALRLADVTIGLIALDAKGVGWRESGGRPLAEKTRITEAEFRAWENGDSDAFEACRAKLKEAEGGLASRILIRYCEDADGDLCRVDLGAELAREAAVDAMDAKVSGGRCAVEKKIEDGEPVFYGRNSARKMDLGRFKRVEWRGVESFHALFRDLLVETCALTLVDDMVDGGRRNLVHPATPGDEPGDWIDGNVAAPAGPVLLPKESACALVLAFARVAEQLHRKRQEAVAEFVEAIILYVKFVGWRAVQENTATPRPAVALLRGLTVEGIWGDAEALEVDIDGEELTQFVQGGGRPEGYRGISDANLHKRRQRLAELLPDLSLDAASRGVLLAWVNRLIAIDAARLISDSERWGKEIGSPAGDTLGCVTAYFKWMLARGNSEYARHHGDFFAIDLAGIRARTTESLITRRWCVSGWAPEGEEFAEFVRCYHLLDGTFQDSGRQLIEAIEARSKGTPRLVPVLRRLFFREGGEAV
jgi:hypothetical protein